MCDKCRPDLVEEACLKLLAYGRPYVPTSRDFINSVYDFAIKRKHVSPAQELGVYKTYVRHMKALDVEMSQAILDRLDLLDGANNISNPANIAKCMLKEYKNRKDTASGPRDIYAELIEQSEL